MSLTSVLFAETETFDRRAKHCLNQIAAIAVDWERGTRSAYVRDAHSIAQAKFAIGRDAEAREIIEKSLATAWDAYYDPEFPAWATMDCYLRWKDVPGKYTPGLKEKTKRHFATRIARPERRGYDRLGTYNQRWMRAVALYLAHEEWPDAGIDKYTDTDPTGVQQIDKYLHAIVHRAHNEILSGYNLFDFGAVLTLYSFAADDVMRQKAKMTLDWMMIHHASFFFKGHCGGSTHRTYSPLSERSGGAPPDGLYFAGRHSDRSTAWKVSHAVVALAAYRPPAIVLDIARQRDRPFLTRASNISYHTKDRQLSYFNRDYVLFSQYEVENRMGLASTWHHEALRWALRWDAPSTQLSTFFLKHPCPKRGDLLGDTWFHQVLQHKTSLVGVFNIPPEKPQSFVERQHWRTYGLGVYPEGYRAIINETSQGRLFLHYGTVMIGLHCTEPFQPKLAEEHMGTRKAPYWDCRFPCGDGGLKMGFVVETALPGDYAGPTPEHQLKAFCEELTPKFDKAVFTVLRGRPTMEYSNMNGVSMFIEWRNKGYDTIRKIKGAPIPDISKHEQWPLLDNPWVHQEVDGDILTLCHGGRRIVYDFARWKVTGNVAR